MNINIRNLLSRPMTISLLFVLMSIINIRAFADSDDQARTVIQNAIQGYGGEETWKQKGTMIVHETQTRNTDDGPLIVKLIHYMNIDGQGYRIELESAQGKQEFGWHGHHFWAVQNGQPGDDELIREARRTIADAYYRFSLPFVLADSELHPEYQGTDNVNGIETEVLKITYQDGPTAGYWVEEADAQHQNGHGQVSSASEGGHHHSSQEVYYFYFDKNYRIVKIYFSHHGDDSYETFLFEDYKEIDGILREHKRNLYRPDGDVHYQSVFTSIEFIEAMEPGFFSTPKH